MRGSAFAVEKIWGLRILESEAKSQIAALDVKDILRWKTLQSVWLVHHIVQGGESVTDCWLDGSNPTYDDQ